MRKIKLILIATFLISFVSCNEKKIEELNYRISELESQNKNLTDSISKSLINKIEKSQIVGLTSKPTFRVGEKAQVNFIFAYQDELMTYDVYTSNDEGDPDELIFENLTESQFEYDFISNKAGEQQIELIAVFKMNDSENTEYHIPTNLFVTITE